MVEVSKLYFFYLIVDKIPQKNNNASPFLRDITVLDFCKSCVWCKQKDFVQKSGVFWKKKFTLS